MQAGNYTAMHVHREHAQGDLVHEAHAERAHRYCSAVRLLNAAGMLPEIRLLAAELQTQEERHGGAFSNGWTGPKCALIQRPVSSEQPLQPVPKGLLLRKWLSCCFLGGAHERCTSWEALQLS